MSASQKMASVIIPTLQHAESLPSLLQTYATHPRVLEILVINNSPAPLTNLPDKVRVLQQEKNIYVNPAWNLGAAEARGDYLIISNDDINIDHGLIDYALKLLDRRLYPLLGVHRGFVECVPVSRARHRPVSYHNRGYGALMFLPAKNYVPIPEDAKIFGGDDWLFWQQSRVPGHVLGFPLRTEMGTTSSREEFAQVAKSDAEFWGEQLPRLIGSKRWHRVLPHLEKQYERNRAIRQKLTGLIQR